MAVVKKGKVGKGKFPDFLKKPAAKVKCPKCGNVFIPGGEKKK